MNAKKTSRHSKGKMIVLIGPDGSGKTTIRNSLQESLSLLYPAVHFFYFRPGLLPFPGVLLGLREDVETGVNPDPHGHKKERFLKSLARFVYYVIDFVLGYWIKVRPCIRKGEAVIFDRYYYDYFVDRFRYNMSVPPWLPRCFLCLIHDPDVTVYLHASAENLYRRKQELPVAELNRQIREFENLVKKLPHSLRVSTERPVAEITGEIVAFIQKGNDGS